MFGSKNKEKKNKSILFYLGFLWKLTYEYEKILTIIFLLLAVITSLLPQVEAFAIGKLIDAAIKSSSDLSWAKQNFIIYIIGLCIVMFVSRLLYDLNSYISKIFDLRQAQNKDEYTLGKVLSVQPHVFEDSEFIKLKNKVDYNSWKVPQGLLSTTSVITSFIGAVITIVIFSSYDLKIVVAVFISLIAPSIVNFVFGKEVWGIWDSLSDEKVVYGLYRGRLYNDTPSIFTEIKVLNYGNYLLNKALSINRRFLKSLEKNEKKRLLFNALARILEFTVTGYAIYLVFSLLVSGRVSVGQFVFVISLFNNLKNSIAFALSQVTSLMADGPFFKSLYDLLTYTPAVKITDGLRLISSKEKIGIELKDVWFKYPGTSEWVLKGINMRIESTNDVAIVGKNGAGKTTLIKLLMRIYDPDKGEILVNRINIKELSLEEYYKKIGILSQDFCTFGFSAWENIYIGDVRSKLYMGKIREAAASAKADEFIKKFPQGYDTFLTREIRDGIQPSGGQWQRLAIARVFYRDPSLIILDEPTSAIDSLAEEEIFSNLKDFAKEKTIVMVSHRFATVKKADYIYVIDDGRVVESGTHADLLKLDSEYAKMYSAQNN
jgi:ABC-type multidrug transport system fused ATPase/permease subunit